MNDVVDLVILDYAVEASRISHVKFFISAREIKLLISDVCCDYVLSTKFLADSVGEWDSDLSLNSSQEHLAFLPIEVVGASESRFGSACSHLGCHRLALEVPNCLVEH